MAKNRLKELRTKKGLSQIRVQIETGIDQSDYSKIENGKRYPTYDQARQLSFLFDTSLDYIYGLTDETKPYPRPEKEHPEK